MRAHARFALGPLVGSLITLAAGALEAQCVEAADCTAPTPETLAAQYRWFRAQGFPAPPGDGLCGGGPALDLPADPDCSAPDEATLGYVPVYAARPAPSELRDLRDVFSVLLAARYAWLAPEPSQGLAGALDRYFRPRSRRATGACGTSSLLDTGFWRALAEAWPYGTGPAAFSELLALTEQKQQKHPLPLLATAERILNGRGGSLAEVLQDYAHGRRCQAAVWSGSRRFHGPALPQYASHRLRVPLRDCGVHKIWLQGDHFTAWSLSVRTADGRRFETPSADLAHHFLPIPVDRVPGETLDVVVTRAPESIGHLRNYAELKRQPHDPAATSPLRGFSLSLRVEKAACASK